MYSTVQLTKKWVQISKEDKLRHRSLFLFNRDNKFRVCLHRMCTSSYFEYFILVAIIGSCVILSTQGRQQEFDLTNPVSVIDLVLNCIFGVEALIKIVAYGFFMHRGAYLRDPWNIFDFIVVLFGGLSDIIVMSSSSNKTFSLKALRLFRVFRPLRLIVKSNNLKVVLDTILKSFNVLIHVLLFIFLIITMYAITGMELFGNTIYTACVDPLTQQELQPRKLCHTSDTVTCSALIQNATCSEVSSADGFGTNPFSNMPISMLTVLQVITMEDWVFISYNLSFFNSGIVTWIYFISLVLLGGYFAVDLLMGVLGNQYLRTKESAKIAMEKRKAMHKDSEQQETEDRKRLKSFLSNMKTRCNGSLDKIATKIRPIVNHPAFFYSVNFIVFADVISSSIYAHVRSPHSDQLPWLYMGIKFGFVVMYIAEILLTGLGIGFIDSFKNNGYFVISVVITLASLLEFVITLTNWSHGVYIGVSVTRAITMIELFKLTRFWTQLRTILRSLCETLNGVVYLFILLFIVLSNYALLGNQLFGNPDETSHLTSGTFNSFGSSLLLTFVLLTGDNWISEMFACYDKANDTFTKLASILFFISFVVIGNFILMNVFLGIIVDNLTNDFEESHEEEFEQEKMKNKQKATIKQIGIIGKIFEKRITEPEVHPFVKVSPKEPTFETPTDKTDGNVTAKKHVMFNDTPATCEDMTDDQNVEQNITNMNEFVGQTLRNTVAVQFALPLSHQSTLRKVSSEFDDINPHDQNNQDFALDVDMRARARSRAFSMMLNPEISHPIPHHNALFMFPHTSSFRRKIFYVVTSSKFTYTVCFAILMSCLIMAFDDPLNRDPDLTDNLKILDYLFTVLFTVEVILKSVAYGFLFGHRNCYLRKPMNMLDFAVVVFSLLNIVMDILGYSHQLQLKEVRIIRIIRMLKISTQLKRVINCLVNSLQKICYFLVLYFLILFIYSILGVHLYRDVNKTSPPLNSSITVTLPQYNNATNITTTPTQITPQQLSFNNFGDGMLTLFVLSTMDDWFLFLKQLSRAPETSELTATLFMVSFILLMSFIIINVFVGFVIVMFQKERSKDDKFQVLNSSAQECLLSALSASPVRSFNIPDGFIKQWIWNAATSKLFQEFSMVLILINTGFMMTKHARQSDTFSAVQRWANIIFTSLFTFEIVVKIIAFTFKALLYDYWLLFDTIVILGSWIDIVLAELHVPFLNLSIFRLFRVARLAQVVGKGGNLRQLFMTFLKSMKCVPSIACLMALILYFYAVLGTSLFGKIRLEDDTPINTNNNFQSFIQSILVLFRVTTLDQWHAIMLACANTESLNCQDSATENCGSVLSYVYFASFVFVCSYIMTNLFLAFIMDNFVYLTHDLSELDSRHICRFTAMWGFYDSHGTGRIKQEELVLLLKKLDPPLGNGALCPNRSIYARILKLRIPVELDGTIKFSEVLLKLVLDFLRLDESNEVLRDDLYLLFPKIDDDLLDRTLPLSYDPRIYNSVEKHFYKMCASYVIGGYYKVYKGSLSAATRMRFPVADVLKPTIKSPLKLKTRIPSVEITTRRCKSTTTVEIGNALKKNILVKNATF